jgi:CBS domain containing-hemolysin-like protein
MQYQVPQHIDIEEKIVGSFTLKQIIYLLGNLGLAFISFSLIPITAIGGLFAIFFLTFGFLLSFYKYNNRPFAKLVESMFYFFLRPRLYVWKPRPKIMNKVREIDMSKYRTTRRVQATTSEVMATTSRLDDASWQINM